MFEEEKCGICGRKIDLRKKGCYSIVERDYDSESYLRTYCRKCMHDIPKIVDDYWGPGSSTGITVHCCSLKCPQLEKKNQKYYCTVLEKYVEPYTDAASDKR